MWGFNSEIANQGLMKYRKVLYSEVDKIVITTEGSPLNLTKLFYSSLQLTQWHSSAPGQTASGAVPLS